MLYARGIEFVTSVSRAQQKQVKSNERTGYSVYWNFTSVLCTRGPNEFLSSSGLLLDRWASRPRRGQYKLGHVDDERVRERVQCVPSSTPYPSLVCPVLVPALAWERICLMANIPHSNSGSRKIEVLLLFLLHSSMYLESHFIFCISFCAYPDDTTIRLTDVGSSLDLPPKSQMPPHPSIRTYVTIQQEGRPLADYYTKHSSRHHITVAKDVHQAR